MQENAGCSSLWGGALNPESDIFEATLAVHIQHIAMVLYKLQSLYSHFCLLSLLLLLLRIDRECVIRKNRTEIFGPVIYLLFFLD